MLILLLKFLIYIVLLNKDNEIGMEKLFCWGVSSLRNCFLLFNRCSILLVGLVRMML